MARWCAGEAGDPETDRPRSRALARRFGGLATIGEATSLVGLAELVVAERRLTTATSWSARRRGAGTSAV